MCTECLGFAGDYKCVKVYHADVIILDPAHNESQEELMEKKKHIHDKLNIQDRQ
jgi:hypothetical protein